ncbi:Nudix hydrolase 20 [Hibiscus syriacus]|uniref:Nudix hydrolase 20 n=1 Tax=Hibiscus syriacus TaxID=106335 RepID=A0A6A3A2F8_HIBSY|nr:nudix hydrolase 20, chloroplastic-like [Hibiscus syriacus]XP_039006545.1 nudix hydrolase 20, chloroplastic-like [Hibiscus syriacus]XP_039006546.1 nudix hydrolase 20, chloroplastic-like [Hibiscus syriacus]KAE8698378.1 Nudix hydrolase 20 [Hibiscus syriacus]
MACCCKLPISYFRAAAKSRYPFPNCSISAFPPIYSPFNHPMKPFNPSSLSASTTAAAPPTFSWDDVVRVSLPEYNPLDASDLRGFFDKIEACNRGAELQYEFLPFVIEDQVVGYIHKSFAENLRKFEDVFILSEDKSDGGNVRLHRSLQLADDRTRAVEEVIKCLAENKLIPGIRNELYPVTSSYGAPVFFSIERAAAPYFGIKAYGVHMNGYVEKDGQKFLWVGKRSPVKPTFPGMLDHLVAGGLPHEIACGENLIKECEEEAGISRSLASRAIPVGAVSYSDIDGHRFKRDVLFTYDLKLPESFVPNNQDGEVESFKLIPVKQVSNIIKRTQFFKSNCSIVIIDFLFRHGYITPECFGYLDLLRSLKSGDCS